MEVHVDAQIQSDWIDGLKDQLIGFNPISLENSYQKAIESGFSRAGQRRLREEFISQQQMVVFPSQKEDDLAEIIIKYSNGNHGSILYSALDADDTKAALMLVRNGTDLNFKSFQTNLSPWDLIIAKIENFNDEDLYFQLLGESISHGAKLERGQSVALFESKFSLDRCLSLCSLAIKNDPTYSARVKEIGEHIQKRLYHDPRSPVGRGALSIEEALWFLENGGWLSIFSADGRPISWLHYWISRAERDKNAFAVCDKLLSDIHLGPQLTHPQVKSWSSPFYSCSKVDTARYLIGKGFNPSDARYLLNNQAMYMNWELVDYYKSNGAKLFFETPADFEQLKGIIHSILCCGFLLSEKMMNHTDKDWTKVLNFLLDGFGDINIKRLTAYRGREKYELNIIDYVANFLVYDHAPVKEEFKPRMLELQKAFINLLVSRGELCLPDK
jgi:hypothetical protein